MHTRIESVQALFPALIRKIRGKDYRQTDC
jgi:hypothetical protein